MDQLVVGAELVEGQRVLLVDDLLATGGTMAACCELVEGLGASVVDPEFLGDVEGAGPPGALKAFAPANMF